MMPAAYAQYLLNSSSVPIGITSEGMYPPSEAWQFCFGWRVGEIRSAVVSSARMNPPEEGEPTAVANVTARSEKVTTGSFYYRKDASGNPRSVWFNGILGTEELDMVGEDF